MTGLHDAAAGAGDDHPAALNDAPAEFLRGRERRVFRLRAGGAEYRGLAAAPVGREDLEAVAQLADRRGQELDVAAAGMIAEELVRRLLDLRRVLVRPGRGVGRAVRSGFGRLGVGDRVEGGAGRGIRHVTTNVEGS
jgi:hypothetical protein